MGGDDPYLYLRGILGNVIALAGGKTIEYILKSVLAIRPKGHLVIITPHIFAAFIFRSGYHGTCGRSLSCI